MKPFATIIPLDNCISLATMTMGCAEMNGGSTAGGGSPAPSASSAGYDCGDDRS